MPRAVPVSIAPGSVRFERMRRLIAARLSKEVEQVSNADVVAALTASLPAPVPKGEQP